MSKYAGMVETRKIDRLLTADELDKNKRHALLRFQQDLDAIIMSANQQVLKRSLPEFDREAITRMAVRVAELRGSYLKHALEIAQADGKPTPHAIAELRETRCAFDEMREAFEALERVIDRGYIKLS